MNRALWWGIFLLVLLYGVLQVAVRTDWFRARVEKELSALLGLEMQVGRIRATESLNLKIRDVISVSADAGIEARLIRFKWKLWRAKGSPWVTYIGVDGWGVTFAPDEAGVLQPAVLTSAKQLLLEKSGLSAKASFSVPPDSGGRRRLLVRAARRGIPTIELSRGHVRIQNAQGGVEAAAEQVNIRLITLHLPENEPFSYWDVQADTVQLARGARIIGLHIELLDTGTMQFLNTLEATDWGGITRNKTTTSEYKHLLDSL